MGKLFDSIKRRNGLGVVPADAPRPSVAPADEHVQAMPFYEVPNTDGREAATVSIAKPSPAKVADKPKPVVTSARVTEEQTPRSHVAFALAEPQQRRSSQEIDEQVVVVHQPDSSRAGEYRELASHLARIVTARELRSLTLVPLEEHGTLSLTMANLGCAWAEFTRHPVVLIDAARSHYGNDLASLLGLGQAPGWEELMTGATLAETIQQTGRAWLDLIASGRRLAWANTQAWAQRAGSVLQSLSKHYRHILLVGPPYPHSPLGLVLAEASDSTCIIVPADQPNHPQKEPLLKAIAQQGGQVLGTIVLDAHR
jgi:hypothetical protein